MRMSNAKDQNYFVDKKSSASQTDKLGALCYHSSSKPLHFCLFLLFYVYCLPPCTYTHTFRRRQQKTENFLIVFFSADVSTMYARYIFHVSFFFGENNKRSIK